MFPYWILFSVFAAGAVQYGRHAKAGVRSAPILAAAGLFVMIMVGLRFETGGDWRVYIEIFERNRYQELGSVLTMSDPGYELLNWLTMAAGLDIWFVNLLCAAIFTFGLVKFAMHQTNPWLAICVAVPYLIIVVAMGYTRQAVAIGLIMAGLTALEKQSFIRFAIYLIIATTFHKTAVIIVPLVALITPRHRFAIGVLMLAMGYFLYNWLLESSMDKLVVNYIDQEYSSQGAAIRVAMNLVPATIFLFLSKRFGLPGEQQRLWRNFSLAALVMLGLLFVLPSSTVVDRLSLYLIPLQLFVLSRLPDALPNGDGTRNGQLLLVVIIYSALVQFVWLNYAAHASFWVPYNFYPTATETDKFGGDGSGE